MNNQLHDAIETVVKNEINNIHTCLPGKIEKYYYETQKADVKPLVKKLFKDGESLELPVIVSVPVVWMRGGGALFSFPLNRGDGVLLLFAERNINLWLETGEDSAPENGRKFDLTDCIAVPGLVSFSAEIYPDDNENVSLKFNDASVKINTSGTIDINNGNLTVDL